MSMSVLALFTPEGAERILSLGLDVARQLGLPVTSWRTGDPTKSLYKYLAVKLASVDGTVANLAKSAFLSQSSGAWLKILALEVYGVEAQEATFAAGTVTLENTGGGYYPREPGDLAFKSSITGKTYHSTTGGILDSGPGTTLTVDFIADEAGSDSTLAPDELDTLVTGLIGVEIQSSTAAVGLDDQSDESIREQCQDSLGALSPAGPADVYRYVAKNSDLTGITTITRAFTVDNEDGTVTVYVAGAAGAVSGGDVTAVQDAFDQWATPNCVTATAISAVGVTINVDATVAYSGSLSDVDLEAAIQDKLLAVIGAIDIGGAPLVGGGFGVSLTTIRTAIQSIEGVTDVTMTTPSANTELDPNEVPVLGTVDITVY